MSTIRIPHYNIIIYIYIYTSREYLQSTADTETYEKRLKEIEKKRKTVEPHRILDGLCHLSNIVEIYYYFFKLAR